MKEIQVVYYKTDKGKEPYNQFLNTFKDKQIVGIIHKRIDRIRKGNLGDCKSIKGCEGLYELRFNIAGGLRIYFGKEKEILVIFLYGGNKSTQKRDIEKAKQYWKDYKNDY